MNINPTMGIGFKGTVQPQRVTKLFVPAKEGTLRCEIGGQLDNKITVIKYDLLKKGEIVESKAFLFSSASLISAFLSFKIVAYLCKDFIKRNNIENI